jgi:hypothetical protein
MVTYRKKELLLFWKIDLEQIEKEIAMENKGY